MKTAVKVAIAGAAIAAVGSFAVYKGAEAYGGGGGWGGHHRGGHHMRGGPGGGRGAMMRQMFKEADADNDGKLTQAEIDAARDARFAKFDTDADGRMSLDEFQALWLDMVRTRMVRGFQRLDTDGDAAITKGEFDEPFSDLVARMDRNGDGALSRDDRRGRGWGRGDGRRGEGRGWRNRGDRDGAQDDDQPAQEGSDQ